MCCAVPQRARLGGGAADGAERWRRGPGAVRGRSGRAGAMAVRGGRAALVAALGLLAAVALLAAPAAAVEGECEVCVTVVDKIKEGMEKKERSKVRQRTSPAAPLAPPPGAPACRL